jgi:hypothetical protein
MLIKDHKGILSKFQSQLKQQQQLIKLVDDTKGVNSSRFTSK